MSTILIIDDNPAVYTALDVLLSLHGYNSIYADSPAAGLECLQQTSSVDLIIQDMNFSSDTTSGEEGVALFKELRNLRPLLPIILLTAWSHLEQAVALVKAGAADYMAKPWDDDKLITTINNLLQLSELRQHQAELENASQRRRQTLADDYDLAGLIYQSEEMHALVATAARVANADVPILITGPNGCGKEKIAELIQRNSARKDAPFVRVNMGAIPADLLEAELFGVEAGAYTGAQKARQGRFEAANGGTLFLDEIGNLPLSGQVKLLRVLQTGEYQRLGSHKAQHADVRIISATNSQLPAAIEAGDFREDLFYRLNVIELQVPPLTQRKDDILPLAEHFLKHQFELNDSAKEALELYQWPGNVRELENCMQRAMLLCNDQSIKATDLGLPQNPQNRHETFTAESNSSHNNSTANNTGKINLAATNIIAEEDIRQALHNANGTISVAARELGISRQALYRRMQKYGLSAEQYSG